MKTTSSLLDRLLEKYPDTSRRRAKEWIVEGRISVNGVTVRKPHQVVNETNDVIGMCDSTPVSPEFGSGWPIHPEVELLHLDSSLAVVNKAAGLVSVPAKNCKISALSIVADFLSGRLKTSSKRISKMSLPPDLRRCKPLRVHRLDQYTSGVFCMAMNLQSRAHLIEQLNAHTINREYIAFAQGHATTIKGTWRHCLRLSKDELSQQIVSPKHAGTTGADVVEAVTHFEVIAAYGIGSQCVTQLRLRLETGRKHQIRAQAAAAGLPLIGDRTYNPDYRVAGKAPIPFSRQALHAERLELNHPQSGKRLSWRARWPADLRKLEKMLSANLR